MHEPALPEIVVGIDRISAERGMVIAPVDHAGDGNTHPVIVRSARDEGSARLVVVGDPDAHRSRDRGPQRHRPTAEVDLDDAQLDLARAHRDLRVGP